MRARNRFVRRDHLFDDVRVVCRVCGGRADVANGHHPVEDVEPALLGGRQLILCAERVVHRRCLRQPSKEARLRPAQVVGMDLEIRLGRGLGPIRAVAVVDAVEVELEDLRLRVAALHLLGEDELMKLPADCSRLRLLCVEDVVLHHLLCDGRRAQRGRVVREVVADCDHQAAIVDARVVVERAVLGVDGRALQLEADLAQRDHRAVLVIQGFDQVALAVEDPGGLRQLGRLQLLDGGEVAREIVNHADRGHGAEQPHRGDRHQHDQRQPREPSA